MDRLTDEKLMRLFDAVESMASADEMAYDTMLACVEIRAYRMLGTIEQLESLRAQLAEAKREADENEANEYALAIITARLEGVMEQIAYTSESVIERERALIVLRKCFPDAKFPDRFGKEGK